LARKHRGMLVGLSDVLFERSTGRIGSLTTAAAVQGQDLESVSGHSEVRRWRCQGCPPGLRVNL